ncbi:hypothetical protein Tco_0907046 [Tanacetum coccineum]|uniref:Uncharacterized protein n=1 Tax=Tanacetum coccineum TaxID=301880 RepID=A0ABQ5CI63_9ASTR
MKFILPPRGGIGLLPNFPRAKWVSILDMGLLDYIRTADPRKVQAVEAVGGLKGEKEQYWSLKVQTLLRCPWHCS